MPQTNTPVLPELTILADSVGPKLAHFGPRRNVLARIWSRLNGISPFASNVALTVGTNAVIGGIGLLTGPICARMLGASGRGELAAIQNLYWFVAILAMLGMPEAALYFSARKKSDSGRIVGSAVLLTL